MWLLLLLSLCGILVGGGSGLGLWEVWVRVLGQREMSVVGNQGEGRRIFLELGFDWEGRKVFSLWR